MFRFFRSCCGHFLDESNDSSHVRPTELLERLRSAANSSGSWMARADRMTYELTVALGPSTHASLMGASSCGCSLVLLGGGAPGPGSPLPMGHVLPSPWDTDAEKFPHKLTWQAVPRRSRPQQQPQTNRLPESWLQLLPHDTKGQPAPDPSAGALVPVLICGRLAGALLVWEWDSPPPSPPVKSPVKTSLGAPQDTAAVEAAFSLKAAAAASRPGVLVDADDKLQMSSVGVVSGEGLRVKGLPAGRSGLLRSPGALASVVGVVRDCLLAPHLDEIRLVCAAAHELAHAPNIPTLATVLATTVATFLASTLHCDLSVRPALVTPPASSTSMQYGFLLQERPSAAAAGCASSIPQSAPQDLEDQCGGSGAGTRLAGLFTRTNSSGVLRTSALLRSRSFFLSCAEEASDGDSGVVPKSSTGQAFSYGGGGRDGGPVSTTSPLEGVPRKTGNRWKAAPFALATALLGELLRPDFQNSRASSTFTPRSNVPSGPVGGYQSNPTNGSNLKRFLPSNVNDTPPQLIRGNCGSDASTAADGGGRLAAIVLPDLHQYLQDVNRPSGDVLLLLTSQRRTASNLPGGAASNVAGSTGGSMPPACLVLLAANGATLAAAGPDRGISAVENRGCGQTTPTQAGVGLTVPSVQPSHTPPPVSAGREEPSCPPPKVALYITSQERLPGSLLTAAREASREMLQVLLPATLLALTRGNPGLELQELAAVMEARGQPGTATSPAAGPNRDAPTPGNTRNSAPIRPCQPKVPQERALPSPPHQQLQQHSNNNNSNTLADDGAVSVPPTPTRSVASVTVTSANYPGPVLPLHPSALSSISRINTGTGATTSGGSAAPSRWLLEALLRTGSNGGKKTRQRQQAYLSRICRNKSASELLPSASAPPDVLPPPVGVARALLASPTTTNISHMPVMERSPRVGRGMSAAAMTGVSGGLVHSRGDLLDLECVTGRLGTDALLPELPAMRLLLTSFFSTLNDTDADPSPHAAADLRCLRLTRIIGDGGCSIVYGGLLHGLDVAVKVLHPLQPMVTDDDVAGALLGDGGSNSKMGGVGGAGGGGAGEGDVTITAGVPVMGNGGGGCEAPSGAGGPPMWAVARQARLRELMRGVRELAVMSSISHPNIVQVYSYHTQVRLLPAASPGGLPTLVPMETDDGHVMSDAADTHVVIIMECCDLGSLADALDSGLFDQAVKQAAVAGELGDDICRRALSGATLAASPSTASGHGGAGGSGRAGSGPVPTRHASLTYLNTGSGGYRMRGMYLTLLEVALALRHLHSKNMVHCDVKAANVLIKSSPSDPRGFTCKLGDFGLVGVLRKDLGDGCEHPAGQEGPVGTVTHLAPEYYTPGTKLGSSVDVYAFGIVMWEVYTGKPPFRKFAATHFEDLPYKVVHERLRPRWPRGTPSTYRTLAAACWAPEPSARPTAAVIVTSLQQFMES